MRLLYFTASYPFGIGEQWKANELKELVHHFESVTVIPFSYAGNKDHPKTLPPGVRLKGPLFEKDTMRLRKSDLVKVIFSRYVFSFLKELIYRQAYRRKDHIVSWLLASLNIVRLMKHPVIREVDAEADRETVLYFYWGRGSCEILPFIRSSRFGKIFVRMHRYDLFEYENKNYIPYRKTLLDHATLVAPSSVAGLKHLRALYPQTRATIEVVRCGTIGNGKLSTPSHDGILRVVSCSFLSPVKRVNLMIESLRDLTIPVEWHHIGDGALRKELEDLAHDLGVADKFIFKGAMDSTTVLDYYTSHKFDVFVNTSASEGVPFSIMEAFSVGIPVIATDVGGSGEIVDDRAGKLLPKDLTGRALADALTNFYYLSDVEKAALRKEVFHRYKNYWDAEKLSRELAVILTQKKG